MKTKNYALIALLGLGLSAMAQTYTGTPWKSGGWNYGTNNVANFAVDNVIEAWQYDKGTYMQVPTDLTATAANITAFQAGDFAAGLIKAPATAAPDLTSCEASKNIWDASTSGVLPAIRKKFLNRRKGDTTAKYETSCPAIVAGTEVLGADDPASYTDAINISAFTMHDSFGRLTNGGSALRYSVSIESGQYNFIFKGNANIARMRLLKRSAENLLTEVYNGTVSGTATSTFSQKVAASTGTTYGPAATGYDGLIDNLKLYGTGTCTFSTQMDNRAELTDKTKLLTLNLNGNYVVELITEGNGAVGAFTFGYVGPSTGLNDPKTNKTSVYLSENNLIVKLNGFGQSTVNIYNTTGVLVSQKNISSNEAQIAASNFVKGVYVVKIDNAKNTELHKLIVK